MPLLDTRSTKSFLMLALRIITGLILLVCIQWAARGAWALQGPADFQFSSGHSALQIPFEEDDGNILIQTRINHSEPLWFLLDTGANAVVDIRRAQALGLEFESSRQVLGIGGSTEGGVVKGMSIELPGVEILNQSAVALSLDDFSAMKGREVAGILGYEFFSQFVVNIDYEARRIDLYDPRNGGHHPGESFPITFHRQYSPSIDAKLIMPGRDPIEGGFIVDTGFNGSLTLTKSFIEENAVMKSVGQTRQAHGEGVTEVRTSLGRVDGLQIGRSVLKNPITSFSNTDEPVMSGKAGMIGGKALRRFQVVFDYPHGRMILKPNKYFSDPDEFDMAGIALKSEGADFGVIRIVRVLDHSPASEAGLHPKDIIVTIDGRPGKEFHLNDIVQMFQQNGREYLLGIKRGKQTVKLKIKLKRLI